MAKKTIAVVGSGVAGLSTAYHLHKDYHLTVFEKAEKLGGHADTHSLDIDSQALRIDSGFIIFCPDYYPHFSSMLSDLKVDKQETDMSFSAHNPKYDLIYNATSLNKLFCQRRNLWRPRFWRMLFDIVRFYNRADRVLGSEDHNLSVIDYLNKNAYGAGFIEDHLMPMISALWSATPQRVNEFPIGHLVDFFKRHGLMKLIRRPQWYVVKNGSATYVEALQNSLECEWRLNSVVEKIARSEQAVEITVNGEMSNYDAVVIAAHSDQALAMLADASADEQRVLSAIPFERNEVVVHSDDHIMPTNKLAWASWNTEVPKDFNHASQLSCSANYWMNSLQGLDSDTQVFTSLNSVRTLDGKKVYAQRVYHHPVFTAKSVAAQADKVLLDGYQNTYYVGAYWGWGFHEDGARSAFEVSQKIRASL